MTDPNVDQPYAHLVQGTDEWKQARLGRITGSQFCRLITPTGRRSLRAGSKSAWSITAEKYILGVVGERLTGIPQGPEYPTADMKWGTENEPKARAIYEAKYEVVVDTPGFLLHPEEPLIGFSPDGLHRGGGLEIKCRSTALHIADKLRGECPAEHKAQVQGAMWLANAASWDYVGYDPRITLGEDSLRNALWICPCERDEDYIEKLEAAVFAACDTLREYLGRLGVEI